VFVSHAHGDHLARAGRVVCTPETSALQAARGGPAATVAIPLGETRRVGPAELTLTSASHTLGSAMLVARTAHGTIAYTGDYKLRANPLTPPATIPRCDVLVMECTFGEPRYRFPPDAALLARLFAFVDEALADDAVPVVLGYPLGKGQEALWHLLEHGYEVALHGSIANMTDVHERLGHAFPGPGRWTRYVRGALAGRVLLTTPSSRKSAMVTKLPRRRVAYLTGWALHPGAHNIYRDCDLVLPLSDHADFDDLVRTARESGAAKIYTVHGAPGFAAHLRSLGLDAEHLAEHPQAAALVGDGPAAADDASPGDADPQTRLAL
jgi:Cft2 family RNA processing exonuclease